MGKESRSAILPLHLKLFFRWWYSRSHSGRKVPLTCIQLHEPCVLKLNSLASDHSVSVAVVEAGKHIILNSTLVPSQYSIYIISLTWLSNIVWTVLVNDFMGNPEIDWQFKSVPQVRATNAPVDMPRGKLLGGTALVNGMYYVR